MGGCAGGGGRTDEGRESRRLRQLSGEEVATLGCAREDDLAQLSSPDMIHGNNHGNGATATVDGVGGQWMPLPWR